MSPFLGPLTHDRVLRLQRSIGGRSSRLKSNKKPFLFSNLADCTANAQRSGATVDDIKEAFALTLGFFFGMRASEILHLKGADVNESEDASMVLITFRNTKTRRSLFTSHDPYVIAGRAPILTSMFALFNTTVGFTAEYPIFHAWRCPRRDRVRQDFVWTAQHAQQLSRDWLSRAVRRWAPDCSPHSLRVGCATEAWAAGVSLEKIQALGRWKSSAALLYVIGSLDQTASATAQMGQGNLAFTADGLRAQIGTSPTVQDNWWPDVAAKKWRARSERADVSDSSSSSDDTSEA
jgi:integrase